MVWSRSFFRLLLILVLPIGVPDASAQNNVIHFPGFTVEPPHGNGWNLARPSDMFPGLGGLDLQKAPSWFAVSDKEVPLPLWAWRRFWYMDLVGLEQFAVSKKLPQHGLATAYVRASWVTFPFADDSELLSTLAQAREATLRSLPGRLVSFRIASSGPSVPPFCLRYDSVREELPDKKSESPVAVATHCFLCPHPDARGFIVEVGYGERATKGGPFTLKEMDLSGFLESLKFIKLDIVLSSPLNVRAAMVPVGYMPDYPVAEVVISSNATWVSLGGTWLVRVDTHTNRVTAALGFKKPVYGLLWADGGLWQARSANEIVKQFPASNEAPAVLKWPQKTPSKGGPTLAFDSIWVMDVQEVRRIDRASGQIVAKISMPERKYVDAKGKKRWEFSDPRHLAASDAALWTLCENGVVVRIDPRTNQIAGTVFVGPDVKQLLASHSAAWILGKDGEIFRVDAATDEVKRVTNGSSLCLDGDTPWTLTQTSPGKSVTGEKALALQRIDPAQGQPAGPPVEIGRRSERPSSVETMKRRLGVFLGACHDGTFWLADESRHSLLRVTPELTP